MKLKQYMELLNDLIRENPKCLEHDVVCSKDEEGNGFSPVVYYPSIGTYYDEEFTPSNSKKANAVCVN